MSELPMSVVPAPGGPSPKSDSQGSHAGAPRYGTPRIPSAEFEAVFLTEMLKHAGFGKALGSQAGGAGESGFSDLLVREVAERIARSRPLGIATMLDAAVRSDRP